VHESIDEPAIRRMVDDFYGRVRDDDLLGPIFEAQVAGRWPAHLDKMVTFWRAVLLHDHRYSGNPRAVHAALPHIDAAHFERWLDLFAETLGAVFPAETAALILTKARAMASALLGARGPSRRHLPMRPEP
jgi:hemoglobin